LFSSRPEYEGEFASAPSAPSAPAEKRTFQNDLASSEVRTVGDDADANLPSTDANRHCAEGVVRSTVRVNPLKTNGADAADGADANIPCRSAPERNDSGWKMRL
jgi:hypothetical protein